jgi:hypothetical protein
MMTKLSDVNKPASPEFLNQRLTSLDEFKAAMRAVVAVPKAELDARLTEHPLPPQKRGAKPKSANRE